MIFLFELDFLILMFHFVHSIFQTQDLNQFILTYRWYFICSLVYNSYLYLLNAFAGERLWSDRTATQSTDAAHPRIEAFRCLLNRRGIEAAPVNNANARESPSGPGSCLQQRR